MINVMTQVILPQTVVPQIGSTPLQTGKEMKADFLQLLNLLTSQMSDAPRKIKNPETDPQLAAELVAMVCPMTSDMAESIPDEQVQQASKSSGIQSVLALEDTAGQNAQPVHYSDEPKGTEIRSDALRPIEDPEAKAANPKETSGLAESKKPEVLPHSSHRPVRVESVPNAKAEDSAWSATKIMRDDSAQPDTVIALTQGTPENAPLKVETAFKKIIDQLQNHPVLNGRVPASQTAVSNVQKQKIELLTTTESGSTVTETDSPDSFQPEWKYNWKAVLGLSQTSLTDTDNEPSQMKIQTEPLIPTSIAAKPEDAPLKKASTEFQTESSNPAPGKTKVDNLNGQTGPAVPTAVYKPLAEVIPNKPERAFEQPVSDQITKGVATSLKTGETSLVIQLKPEGLGKVTVKLVSDGEGGLTLSLSSDNQQTVKLLQNQMGDLKSSLESQNLNVLKLSATFESNQNNLDLNTGTNFSFDHGGQSDAYSRYDAESQSRQHGGYRTPNSYSPPMHTSEKPEAVYSSGIHYIV